MHNYSTKAGVQSASGPFYMYTFIFFHIYRTLFIKLFSIYVKRSVHNSYLTNQARQVK